MIKLKNINIPEIWNFLNFEFLKITIFFYFCGYLDF